MATPSAELKLEDRKLEDLMAEEYKSVLEILAQYESMPFLELTSLSDIDDEVLGRIIDDLENKGVVRVSNRGNLLEEIVTLRDKSSALASTAP